MLPPNDVERKIVAIVSTLACAALIKPTGAKIVNVPPNQKAK
jgi:hypothetical protein